MATGVRKKGRFDVDRVASGSKMSGFFSPLTDIPLMLDCLQGLLCLTFFEAIDKPPPLVFVLPPYTDGIVDSFFNNPM